MQAVPSAPAVVAPIFSEYPGKTDTSERIQAKLYSSLLSFVKVPNHIFCVSTQKMPEEVGRLLTHDRRFIHAFIIRAGTLYTFDPLRSDGPYGELVKGVRTTRREKVADWMDDPKLNPWFRELLRSSLRGFLLHVKRLGFDKDHDRYFFRKPSDDQDELTIEYKSLGGKTSARTVVRRPMNKRTGEKRDEYHHAAVSLQPMHIKDIHWCVSLRPELRITSDGERPIESKRIGAKVTRIRAKKFNFDVFQEIHFWRQFLSDGSPNIVIPFADGIELVIGAELLETDISWPPALPAERRKKVVSQERELDLFERSARTFERDYDIQPAITDDEDDDVEDNFDEDVDL